MGLIKFSYNAGKNHPMYGKHHLQKTKDKIRKSLTGRKMPQEIKDKISNSQKGILKTKEHNRKNSLSQLGSKNHNWKGGVSYFNTTLRQLEKYKEWRTFVFKRDNYTCSKCKKICGEL
jgi:hypothetical protein